MKKPKGKWHMKAVQCLAAVVVLLVSYAPSTLRGEEGEGAVNREGVVQLWARLKAKSDVPTVKQIAPYHEALIVYEWEVTNVEKGRFDGKRLRVAHWVVFDSMRPHY